MFDYPTEWKNDFLKNSAVIIASKLGLGEADSYSNNELLDYINNKNCEIGERFTAFCKAYNDWHESVVVKSDFSKASEKVQKRDDTRNLLINSLKG